jgi:2-polyprenyl-3-methyl-5-hydroxy-6-metoxy-1,4-benzoquinol methylase
VTAPIHRDRSGSWRGSRLEGWVDGYTADTVYLDQITTQHCPAWFSMISVLNGQPPLDATGKVVWLDIACGTGLAACTVAACHPDFEVWGIDYNPAHIERARRLSRAASLTNVQFVEADVASLARDRSIGPAEVDVVVINGVYSWVSMDNQRHIVDAVRQRLRPGGLAHVMFETAGGWASMTPVAEVLRLMVDADGRRGDLAFHDAAAEMVALSTNGAAYFPMGNKETGHMRGWANLDPRLAAHEYLGGHFAPLDAGGVHELFASAKCTLVGSLDPLEHHHYYSIPPPFADVLASPQVLPSAEMFRDLVLQTAVREDLFRRGSASVTPLEHEAWLLGLEIWGLGRPLSSEPVDSPAMKITLDPTFHQPLIDALRVGPLTPESVLAVHPSWSLSDATTAMSLLIAAGHAAPAMSGGAALGAIEACRRLNRELTRERLLGWPHCGVAAPATGAMVSLDLVEALALDTIWAGCEPTADKISPEVIQLLESLNFTVRDETGLVRESERASLIVRHRVSNLLAKHGALELLGVT